MEEERKESSIEQKIRELTELMNHAKDAYYNESRPIMSDSEYDSLYDELDQLLKTRGITSSGTPIDAVGAKPKGQLPKIKHSHPMLSLDKTKSTSTLRNFIGNKNVILSTKLDGLTILLTYENGTLLQAETRGDGNIGEIVTENAKQFINVPTHIAYYDHLEVEGEAIITYDDFEKINAEISQSEQYKNPRNLASGSVRQLDYSVTAGRRVRFIVWKVINHFSNDFQENLESVRRLGFDIVPYRGLCGRIAEEEDAEEVVCSLRSAADKLSYPIDGIVCTYSDIPYGEALGMTGHHPKHSLAFKFEDEEVETNIKDIEWTMGKTGVLTPTAVFEPVEIDGTTVERASLHNVSIMRELELSPGDAITVYKANMIIPQVADNISRTKSNLFEPPKVCPICGGMTEIAKDNATEVLTCKNPLCKGKLLGKVSHFVSRKAMNIDGLSEATLEKFIDFGWIAKLSDIYHLDEHFDELSSMDGFGEKSVQNLRDAIEQSKHVSLENFIAALSIPGIGTSQSKVLARHFPAWSKFLEAIENRYDFGQIQGFGTVLNDNIHTWFKVEYDAEGIDNLVQQMIFAASGQDTYRNIFDGKVFVITGSLSLFKNRDALVKDIENHGGKVSGSVSKNTSYLINNDTQSSSSKNQKAKALGIQIISENDYVNLMK